MMQGYIYKYDKQLIFVMKKIMALSLFYVILSGCSPSDSERSVVIEGQSEKGLSFKLFDKKTNKPDDLFKN